MEKEEEGLLRVGWEETVGGDALGTQFSVSARFLGGSFGERGSHIQNRKEGREKPYLPQIATTGAGAKAAVDWHKGQVKRRRAR